MTARDVWGTVVGVAPLRVLIDNDEEPLPFEPRTLVEPEQLVLNARVRCTFNGRRLLILGLAGGLDTYSRGEVDTMLAAGYRPTRAPIVFAAGGTFTKTSYPGLRAIRVRVVGGGGGGGGAAATGGGVFSCGTGGGGGGYAEAWITDIAALSASVPVTVGAGGTAVAGGNGGTGGASSFGSACAADGGAGGLVKPANIYSPYVSAPLGGVGTVGGILLRGQGGGIGAGSDTLGSGGSGGSSGNGMGGGAPGVGNGSTGVPGVAGGNYGGGGSGAFNSSGQSARAGGVGAPGIVIVEVFA